MVVGVPRWPWIVLVLLGVGVPGSGGLWLALRPARPAAAWIEGRVVDLEGRPLAGARLRTPRGVDLSAADGRFRARGVAAPQWLEVSRRGFLPRLKAVRPGAPLLIRLSPDDGATLTVHAVGDLMVGRRFFGDPLATPPIEPQLHPGDGVAAHRALLAAMSPLLRAADLSVGNLESPLLADPGFDPGRPRPARFHPGKDYVFASAPATAQALRESGFDVLGLANNHLFDALDAGVGSSLAALDRAGFLPGRGRFGAAWAAADLWRPAIQRRRGQTVALLGCTTIEGQQHAQGYVAVPAQGKAGATACDPRQLTAAIRAARGRGAAVLVMIHGGNEYQRQPTEKVARLSQLACAAGAAAVLNHHPHVLGGLRRQGSCLIATSLGNFLFDQHLWPTFESALLVLHLRHGVVVRAMLEPLLISGYRPYALAGAMADFVARGAAAREAAPVVVESGTLEVDLAQRRRRCRWQAALAGPPPLGGLFHLAPGVWMARAWGPGRVEAGRDLLWVGDFEDDAVGAPARAGLLWNLAPPDKQVLAGTGLQGSLGARLRRSSANRKPLLLAPRHRIPVQPGWRLSILAWVRGPAAARSSLVLAWYGSTRGGSRARLQRPIHLAGGARWQPVRWDVSVPPHTAALGLNVRLDPPASGRVQLELDGLRLLRWQPPAPTAGFGDDWLRVRGPVAVQLLGDYGPGGRSLLPGVAAEAVRGWGRPSFSEGVPAMAAEREAGAERGEAGLQGVPGIGARQGLCHPQERNRNGFLRVAPQPQ